MKLTALLTLAISTLALATPIDTTAEGHFFRARDAKSIVAAVAKIKAGIITLNSSVTNFKGGLLGVIGAEEVQQNTNALSDDLNAAISAANSSAKLDKKDSITVAIKVGNLEPSIFSLLDNIISKKDAFDHAVLGVVSLSSQVLSSLKSQKKLSQEFGNAVASKLVKELAATAPIIQKEITKHFNQAIRVYSNDTSTVNPPKA